MSRNAWARIIDAAERHNDPGRFTALLGWEWSSNPAGANLHRIVVSDANGDQARRFLPYSSVDSPYPEDLWHWLDETGSAAGVRFVAIPHNSNISKGTCSTSRPCAASPSASSTRPSGVATSR